MARRSYNDTTQAFELFLDTICNMFGSILFIAILVCVLLQISPPDGPPGSDSSAAATQASAAAVTAESLLLDEKLAGLRANLATQQRELDAMAGRGDGAEGKRYLELLAKGQQAKTRLDPMTGDLSTLTERIRRARQQIKDLNAQQATLEQTLAGAEERQSRSGGNERVRLPQFRLTAKREIPLLLSGGRLFEVFQLGSNGRPRALNGADVTVVRVPQKTADGNDQVVPAIKVNPGAGTLVERGQIKELLTRTLGSLKKDESYVAIAVYPDSFSEAEWLRDGLIDMGIGYNLVLMETDKPVMTSTGQFGEQ